MVEWLDPIGSKRWEVLPTCVNVRECRDRVEQLGESWPLAPVTNDREGAA